MGFLDTLVKKGLELSPTSGGDGDGESLERFGEPFGDGDRPVMKESVVAAERAAVDSAVWSCPGAGGGGGC